MRDRGRVFVTGGAGYVGSVLVPKLLDAGHAVTVLDLFIYGEDVLASCRDNPSLKEVKGDIRDRDVLKREIPGCDAIIHLACISNDPSYELDPDLGKSINYDAFSPLVEISKSSGVKRFIYASSSSVYGVKNEPDVTEDLSLEPLTDYSKYKAKCEEIALRENTDHFSVTVIRPSTVCGYSPRLRLDLTVNILTNHAVNRGEITVFGGDQMRPNLHIEDMTDLYCMLLRLPKEKIAGKVFNAGYQNYRVMEIAEMVRDVIGKQVSIRTTPSNDPRSYRVCSKMIERELGFMPKHSVEDAVRDLKLAFVRGLAPNALEDSRYYNVKRMMELNLR